MEGRLGQQSIRLTSKLWEKPRLLIFCFYIKDVSDFNCLYTILWERSINSKFCKPIARRYLFGFIDLRKVTERNVGEYNLIWDNIYGPVILCMPNKKAQWNSEEFIRSRNSGKISRNLWTVCKILNRISSCYYLDLQE